MSDKDSRPTLSFGPGGDEGGGEDLNQIMRIPPKTLKEAIGPKGKSMGIIQAVDEANPYYSDEYSNYSKNCQRCVVAYELRRRGYDVIAQPTYKNDKWAIGGTRNGASLDRWRGAFRHAKSDNVGGKNPDKTYSNIVDQMKEYGNGARAVMSLDWKKGNSGHVFVLENRNGKIYFMEPQRPIYKSSHRYTTKDIKNLLKNVNLKTPTLTRTDNLQISYRAEEFVERRPRRK